MSSKLNPSKWPTADQLVVANGGQALHFKLRRGGYSIAGGRISISVETIAIDPDQLPDGGSITMDRLPLEMPLAVGNILECVGGLDANTTAGPNVFGYFCDHCLKVETRWTVLAIESNHVLFGLEAVHDDVQLYDKRAKPTPTRGLFRLMKKPRSKLWIPT